MGFDALTQAMTPFVRDVATSDQAYGMLLGLALADFSIANIFTIAREQERERIRLSRSVYGYQGQGAPPTPILHMDFEDEHRLHHDSSEYYEQDHDLTFDSLLTIFFPPLPNSSTVHTHKSPVKTPVTETSSMSPLSSIISPVSYTSRFGNSLTPSVSSAAASTIPVEQSTSFTSTTPSPVSPVLHLPQVLLSLIKLLPHIPRRPKEKFSEENAPQNLLGFDNDENITTNDSLDTLLPHAVFKLVERLLAFNHRNMASLNKLGLGALLFERLYTPNETFKLASNVLNAESDEQNSLPLPTIYALSPTAELTMQKLLRRMLCVGAPTGEVRKIFERLVLESGRRLPIDADEDYDNHLAEDEQDEKWDMNMHKQRRLSIPVSINLDSPVEQYPNLQEPFDTNLLELLTASIKVKMPEHISFGPTGGVLAHTDGFGVHGYARSGSGTSRGLGIGEGWTFMVYYFHFFFVSCANPQLDLDMCGRFSLHCCGLGSSLRYTPGIEMDL